LLVLSIGVFAQRMPGGQMHGFPSVAEKLGARWRTGVAHPHGAQRVNLAIAGRGTLLAPWSLGRSE
jgi:hypothetical protein